MSELEFQHYPIDVNVIPSSWCVTSLSNLGADIQSGFPTGEHNREGRGIPHIRPMNIDRNGIIDFNDVKYVSPATSVLRLQVGDVLFNNTNSPELIGKTAAIQQCDEWGFSNHMTRLRFPAADLEYRFAAHQLHFLWIARYFRHRCVNHVNQASISGKPLALTVPFLVAPLIEQQRIIAKIEELFSDLDAGVAALKRAKANLKRYRASVLKAAVEGKLTEEWRADHPATEPASALLARILKERRQKWEADQLAKFAAADKEQPKNWREKYVEPTLPNTSDLPELPNGWCWASVEQISTKVVDGVHKKPSYVEEGIPFLTVRNLTAGPGISLANLKYVTPSDHAEFIKRANPEIGDLLISKDGTLGVTRAIRTDVQFSIFVSVALVKPVQRHSSDFLEIAFTSPTVQCQMIGKGSGLQHIHLEDLRHDCIPLPPAAEQHVIVSYAAERLSQIAAAETEIEHGLRRAARLRQSILKQAFEGKLVPQDPTDEPASELLERMRASRSVHERNGNAATQNRTRGRRTKSKQLEGGANE